MSQALPETFTALVMETEKGPAEIKAFPSSSLPQSEVVIKVAYSSINFKDAMVGHGIGKMVRDFPHIPGIDMAGEVVSDSTGAFKAGDKVIATSYDIGMSWFGGYGEYACVPAAWVVPMPAGMTAETAMSIGTAGLTAMLAVMELERNDVTPDKGPVLVTGASGGVGSLSVDILAQLGYTVHASSGKADMVDTLKKLGAAEVVSREDVVDESPRPLLKGIYAGAIDNVGGKTLEYVIRTTQGWGSIAMCGNVGGNGFTTTVLPFILRGINLLGVDSQNCPMTHRKAAWERLATSVKPRHLKETTVTIGLNDLPAKLKEVLDGQARGRFLVKI